MLRSSAPLRPSLTAATFLSNQGVTSTVAVTTPVRAPAAA
jgi:hypothetical protein